MEGLPAELGQSGSVQQLARRAVRLAGIELDLTFEPPVTLASWNLRMSVGSAGKF